MAKILWSLAKEVVRALLREIVRMILDDEDDD